MRGQYIKRMLLVIRKLQLKVSEFKNALTVLATLKLKSDLLLSVFGGTWSFSAFETIHTRRDTCK